MEGRNGVFVTLLCLYSVCLNFLSPASLIMFLSVVSVSDSVVLKADVHVDKCESQEDVLEERDVLYVMHAKKRFADEKKSE